MIENTHSVILPYRDRRQHFDIFLNCYREALKVAQTPWHLVVMDQSQEPLPSDIFTGIEKTYCHEDIGGSFWRSKLLNGGTGLAWGEYITVMDVDCMMPPHFLQTIEGIYAIAAHQKRKTSHRIH